MSTATRAFPLYRRRNLVREVIEGLAARQHDDASMFWRSLAKDLLRQLTSAGVSLDAAQQEVRLLLYAALEEMHRESATASRPPAREISSL